jgi:hypothetical protein
MELLYSRVRRELRLEVRFERAVVHLVPLDVLAPEQRRECVVRPLRIGDEAEGVETVPVKPAPAFRRKEAADLAALLEDLSVGRFAADVVSLENADVAVVVNRLDPYVRTPDLGMCAEVAQRALGVSFELQEQAAHRDPRVDRTRVSPALRAAVRVDDPGGQSRLDARDHGSTLRPETGKA